MPRPTKYGLEQILQLKGPLLSRQLAEIVKEKQKVSLGAAEKAIERASRAGRIARLQWMTFGRGERLCYANSTSEKDVTRTTLELIRERRPVIHRLIRAVTAERILTHRDGLKITGIPTRSNGKSESYLTVIEYLDKLGVAKKKEIPVGNGQLKCLVLNTDPPISQNELHSFAEVASQELPIWRFLDWARRANLVKHVRTKTQVGHRIFDAIGEAVSRRYMVVVYDFNLTRVTDDYVIEGLLDRVYSAYRKKFKQIVITNCVSKQFTKAAQQRAMTGATSQINLYQVKIDNQGWPTVQRIDGISKEFRGAYFENMVRYVLKKSGFHDVQRGIKLYRDADGAITDKTTNQEFTDIDIIAQSKKRDKVVICELKNWQTPVSQEVVEEWVERKLNRIVDFLRRDAGIKREIEAWFIVSDKSLIRDETTVRNKCSCAIKILDRRELIDTEITAIDPIIAKDLRALMLY